MEISKKGTELQRTKPRQVEALEKEQFKSSSKIVSVTLIVSVTPTSV